MIIGIGSDLVSIERISSLLIKFKDRFENKVFTEDERKLAWIRGNPCSRTYAGRWAVKEAFSKALGTGFSLGISRTNINVVNMASGRPKIILTGKAKSYLSSIVPKGYNSKIHTTISDEHPWSQAFVVIEAY